MNNHLTQKKISVVIACYNEEQNIRTLYDRLVKVFSDITPHYEFIYVDNNSTDNSPNIYQELATKDKSVSAILMARNFGTSDSSFSAGTEYASGDAVIWIDGDIQDPPELIKEFVQKWLEGNDVVYGIRAKRDATLIMRWGSKLFYRVFNRMSYIHMPVDAGDFGLMDRKVVNAFNQLPERDRFVRGLRAWVGFKQTGIPYTRADRQAGVSTQKLTRYFYTFRKGIFSFSYYPLSLITYLAVFAFFILVAAGIIYPIWSIVDPAPSGFLTILMIVLFIGSVQMISLAILGEYLGRIFEEVKGRPKFIIREIINDHHKEK